jgi:glyoxylase-like metal-dependent hydrolase (beta-lactamase superfamily II)
MPRCLAALLRRVVSIAVLVAASLSPTRAAAQPALTGLTKEVLADGVYLFRAPSTLDLWTATNAVVIVNDEDVTVFDSFTRAGTARLVIAEIRKITDKPVRTLINSHWHQDHWSGNGEFAKAYPGLRIIATTGTRDYMTRMGPGFFAGSLDRSAAALRASLDTAIRTGKLPDGAALTADARREREREIEETAAFGREVRGLARVLPNVAFRDTLVLWSGRREFRLYSATGDATASAVLHLPAERLLVTGDVLVAPETGDGHPPWTTNSYSITPWLASLRALDALDVQQIVPGQGGAFHDKRFLRLTIEVFAAIIGQVQAALERGVVGVDQVQAAVNVDDLGRRYAPNAALPDSFRPWVASLARRVYQEALDGVAR